jgi:hypothetical protein
MSIGAVSTWRTWWHQTTGGMTKTGSPGPSAGIESQQPEDISIHLGCTFGKNKFIGLWNGKQFSYLSTKEELPAAMQQLREVSLGSTPNKTWHSTLTSHAFLTPKTWPPPSPTIANWVWDTD